MNVIRGVIYVFFVFLAAFLLLLTAIQWKDIETVKALSESGSRENARLTAQLVGELIETGSVDAFEPYPLYELSKRLGIRRMILFDGEGKTINDTSGEAGGGKAPWLSPEALKDVFADGEIFVDSEEDEAFFGTYVKKVSSGGREMALAVVLERPIGERLASDTIFMVAVGSLLFFGLAYVFLRLYSKAQAKSITGSKAETSEVGFVVDTFHGLVSQLKEKEKELEVLRKVAEERAEMIEDYNENVLQSVPSGVITMDGSQRVVKVNAQAERILGIKGVEAIGKELKDVVSGLPEEILKKQGVFERGEMPHTAPSGKRLYIGFSLSPLLDRERKAIGRLFVFTDLTELKALESQAALRQRLSSLGEMAAGIAHELRNPMGVISGYAKILSKKVDEGLKQTVDAVLKEVSAMDVIINDFLSFANPKEPNCSEVALGGLVEDSARSIVGERADVKVSVDIEAGLALWADAVLMRQAVNNLIQNSLDAMADGGELSVKALRRGEHVEITVSDTGHGIPESMREKIFQPFFTTKEGGTGLGLAIVHRIVSTHGGSIDVESPSGGGTAFRIRLPRRA